MMTSRSGRFETMAQIQRQRRIVAFNVKADRYFAAMGFIEKASKNIRANALSAIVRQQCQVNNQQVVIAPVDIEASDVGLIELDNPEYGAKICRLVMLVLHFELAGEKIIPVGGRPLGQFEFPFTGTCVQFTQERIVFVADDTKTDLVLTRIHQRSTEFTFKTRRPGKQLELFANNSISSKSIP